MIALNDNLHEYKHTCAIMSIPAVSFFTGAVVPSIGVVAKGVQVAFMRTSITFINI